MMKGWTKPKLIVLYRGRPEERILVVCKDGAGFPGPDSIYMNECTLDQGGGLCGDCSGRSSS